MLDNKVNIILYDFFLELRKAGLSLDLVQFQEFLHLLTTSKEIPKGKTAEQRRELLYSLCKTLWLYKVEYNDTFRRLFNNAYKEIALSENFYILEQEEEKGTLPNPKAIPNKNKPIINDLPKPKEPISLPPTTSEADKEKRDIYLNFSEGEGGGSPEKQKERGSIKKSNFIFSDEKHLPISTRKTKQIFKKLRAHESYSPTDRIDIKQTVKKIATERIVNKLEFEKEKKTKLNTILLIDHRGAMIAFEEWIQQFAEILKSDSKNNTLQKYYFFNMPIEIKANDFNDYLVFESPTHQKSFKISDIISGLSGDTSVIIFSDAGVMDSSIDTKKVGAFWKIFNLLKRKTEKVIWVNPFPKERWKNDTTKMLSSLIPMVSYTEEGMKKGVKILMK